MVTRIAISAKDRLVCRHYYITKCNEEFARRFVVRSLNEEEKKMKRMMFLLAALAVSSFILLGACKKEKKVEPAADETKTEEPKAEEPKAEEPKEEPKAEEPKAEGGGDSIGVPECDEYITKYTACLGKMPAASKGAMEKGLATMKDAWKKAAATEAGKKALAQGCKTAMETAKKSMAAFKCDF
jgi:septal ring-binding cell division protein DamX